MNEQVATPSFHTYGGTAPENYERYFVPAIGLPLATELVETAHLAPGERVLDMACGTGVVARVAAEQIGPAGHVTALDVNPGMLAVARSVSRPAGIEWREGIAEDTQLPERTYDAALCQMGLQFFADRGAAVGELFRVLAPGGRLVANVPGPMPPVFRVLQRGIRDHVSPEVAEFMSVVFSLDERSGARGAPRRVGLPRDLDPPPPNKPPPARTGGLPVAVRLEHAARRGGWQAQRGRTRGSDARRSCRVGWVDRGRRADPSARRAHGHGEAPYLDHLALRGRVKGRMRHTMAACSDCRAPAYCSPPQSSSSRRRPLRCRGDMSATSAMPSTRVLSLTPCRRRVWSIARAMAPRGRFGSAHACCRTTAIRGSGIPSRPSRAGT